MKPQINRKRFLIVAGLALVLLAAGAVYALAQTDGVINACVLRDGTLRIVADPAECKRNETLYTWNLTGPKGDPGLACWDLNGDGIRDTAEDINLDGLWDAADCKGPQGETGAAGTDGTNGTNGTNGLACWDLNGDGIQDTAEDINLDGLWDAADCKGPQGEPGAAGTNGTNGLACWDLNGDGIQDAAEDINLDGLWDAVDCKGPKGDAGDTANVDAVQAEVDALEAEVAALHDQVDYVYSLHSNTVFLSSAVYDGAMGGLDGADAKCQALAVAAGLPGTFKAWLSDSTGSPSTRFTHSTLRYVRVDGVKVADDWADLTDITMTAGFLYAPINVTENGDQLSEAHPYTWTTTKTDGTARLTYADLSCADWTSNSGDSIRGYIGHYSRVDYYWTAAGANVGYCNTAHHIYCFEQ